MHPKCVQIAEQTKMLEFPASDKLVVEALSRRVVSGNALVSLTSLTVSLLMKISSPFQAVWRTSPGGSSEISNS